MVLFRRWRYIERFLIRFLGGEIGRERAAQQNKFFRCIQSLSKENGARKYAELNAFRVPNTWQNYQLILKPRDSSLGSLHRYSALEEPHISTDDPRCGHAGRYRTLILQERLDEPSSEA